MSEQTSQEPTMEEILASIRRIISEDDAPAADASATPPAATEAPAPAAEPEPAPAAEAAPEPAPEPAPPPPEPAPVEAAAPEPAPEEDEALELTEKVETHGDLDVYTPPPEPAPEPAAAPPARPAEAGLVSASAASAAATAFDRLSATIAMPAEGRTLEDVVRELLRPLLQQWLDDHLPAIVQQAVEAEVERIARSRVR